MLRAGDAISRLHTRKSGNEENEESDETDGRIDRASPMQERSLIKTNSDSTVGGPDVTNSHDDAFAATASGMTSRTSTTSSSSRYRDAESGDNNSDESNTREERRRIYTPSYDDYTPRHGIDMNRSDVHLVTFGRKRSKDEGKTIFGVWRVGRTIGRGSSGTVKLVRHIPTGKICVVKCVKRQTEKADGTKLERNNDGVSYKEHFMIREALMGVLLEHPNIIRMHSYAMGVKHFYFFFEYVAGKDLADVVAASGRLSERRTRYIFKQILSAVDYSHRSFIVHRDLKLENIRVSMDTYTVKVLDFGFATFHSDRFKQHSSCGSPCYAAPEIYAQRPYQGPEVDMWSLGVCLYGMAVGSLPFDKTSFRELSSSVQRGNIFLPPFLSSDIRDLITRMLTVQPDQRATMHDVMNHRWVLTNDGSLDDVEDLSHPNCLPAINQKWVEGILRMPKHDRGERILEELDKVAPKRCQDMEEEWRAEARARDAKCVERGGEILRQRFASPYAMQGDAQFKIARAQHNGDNIKSSNRVGRDLMTDNPGVLGRSKEVFWQRVHSKISTTEARFKESLSRMRMMFLSRVHVGPELISPSMRELRQGSIIMAAPPLPPVPAMHIRERTTEAISEIPTTSTSPGFGRNFHTVIDDPLKTQNGGTFGGGPKEEEDKPMSNQAETELNSKRHFKRPPWLRRMFKGGRWPRHWGRKDAGLDEVPVDTGIVVVASESIETPAVAAEGANRVATERLAPGLPETTDEIRIEGEVEEEEEDDHSFVAIRSSFGYENVLTNKLKRAVRRLARR